MEGRRDGGKGKTGIEEGEKVEWQEGRKNAQNIMKHNTPTPLPDNNFIIIINTFH